MPTGDDLYTRFLETDEMLDWHEFTQGAKKALRAEPDAERVTVPASFLRRVITEITVNPHMFDAYRERFNQLCDELGRPEEKIPTPNAASEGLISRRDFTVGKALHYKNQHEEEGDGEDDKGPF